MSLGLYGMLKSLLVIDDLDLLANYLACTTCTKSTCLKFTARAMLKKVEVPTVMTRKHQTEVVFLEIYLG